MHLRDSSSLILLNVVRAIISRLFNEITSTLKCCWWFVWQKNGRQFIQWQFSHVYYSFNELLSQCCLSLFRLSVYRRCCLDGSSIHQPIFCCLSQSPDTSPIQSSTSFTQYLFNCPLFLWPFTFPSSINLPCLVYFEMSKITYIFTQHFIHSISSMHKFLLNCKKITWHTLWMLQCVSSFSYVHKLFSTVKKLTWMYVCV